jgi:hypothetical protein
MDPPCREHDQDNKNAAIYEFKLRDGTRFLESVDALELRTSQLNGDCGVSLCPRNEAFYLKMMALRLLTLSWKNI